MSARRHLGRLRHRPQRDDLAGVDDAKVTAPAIEEELALEVVRLSDVKAKEKPKEGASDGLRAVIR